MTTHIDNRKAAVVGALLEELVGPCERGTEIDCSNDIHFDTAVAAAGPWLQKGTRDEILARDKPTKRYGVAVLYPYATAQDESTVRPEDESLLDVEKRLDANAAREAVESFQFGLPNEATDALQDIAKREVLPEHSVDSEDLDLNAVNAYRPSSLGVTFLAQFPEGSELRLSASGGRYSKKRIVVEGRNRDWWLRRRWSLEGLWTAEQLSGEGVQTLTAETNDPTFRLVAEIYSRPFGAGNCRMITITLVNRTTVVEGAILEECCLFQTGFSAHILTVNDEPGVLPYPESSTRALDAEERSINLLYRHAPTYAIGHGCAADWTNDRRTIYATCLPTFETPAITPDVRRTDGTILEVPMAALAGNVNGEDGFSALEEVITLYEQWINKLRLEAEMLPEEHREAARKHISDCLHCLQRMHSGLIFLKSDVIALEAFRLANQAILLQQTRSSRQARRLSYDAQNKCWTFSDPFPMVRFEAGRSWRAFQIAFLLLSIPSVADGKSLDRNTVELIWFPTGGGKTEAYLGLSAFSIFYHRLICPSDTGVHVLMRYTLRLLTAQQFQRASGLIVAMEYLRRKNDVKLGPKPFSIGIWLGGSTTPNDRADAIKTYTSLTKGIQNTSNKFIINRCPWCSAQMGPLRTAAKTPSNVPKCPGYERANSTVVFKCTDPLCDFSSGLPIFVIDEDIYEERPTLLIGTVDKFAMLAWKPMARSIFGLGIDGKRLHSPPNLIIQDELHLISGPLGSIVGLYEVVISDLTTDHRTDPPILPKIVSSTATIRRFEEQVRSLYGRSSVALFPPPGLTAGDSFFARYERATDGSLTPGQKYLGVHAPGLGSMQTVQVRTYSALLQAPMSLTSPLDQDPWWTLLTFFNSLRELGTTLSLFQSDIPDYQNVLRARYALRPNEIRRLRNIMELTGRLRGDEVQEAIDSLDTPVASSNAKPVDVCLASNIIEVGIDIPRLSLICIVGQPKTTSQYIQVTGRVGRQRKLPGLVVTIYGASKPRDRSHFERFRSYHERLYAQVEPTSVTPFSPQALDRVLHAVMAAYARQAGSARLATSPDPYPDDLMKALNKILVDRVRLVDPLEEQNLQRLFELRKDQWKRWGRIHWEGKPTNENTPLLREAGSYVSPSVASISWSTPMSMRNVDAECEVEITQNYLNDFMKED